MIENTLDKFGDDVDSAWMGIYKALLWYVESQWDEHPLVPHIIDADKLYPGRGARGHVPTIWASRAYQVSMFLAEKFRVKESEMHQQVDALMRLQDYQGLQRQNPLGIAFIASVELLLQRFCGKSLKFMAEVSATDLFPGIHLPGRSLTPKIDLVALEKDVPVAVFSIKWSIRHDRLGDITSECPAYKDAGRRLRRKLEYYVITNEFDPSRLSKLLNDSCVDGVVHVKKELVTKIAELNGRLENMIDLSDLLRHFSN